MISVFSSFACSKYFLWFLDVLFLNTWPAETKPKQQNLELWFLLNPSAQIRWTDTQLSKQWPTGWRQASGPCVSPTPGAGSWEPCWAVSRHGLECNACQVRAVKVWWRAWCGALSTSQVLPLLVLSCQDPWPVDNTKFNCFIRSLKSGIMFIYSVFIRPKKYLLCLCLN